MMKHTIRIGLLVAALVLLAPIVLADVAFPTITTVYFEQGGTPHEQPVDYSVKCYGYNYADGWYDEGGETLPEDYDPANPEVVYTHIASCPEYGCTIDATYYYNYRHIDYCTLEGETEGEAFTIHKYSQHPDPVDCEWSDIRTCEEHFTIPSGPKAFSDVEAATNEFYDAIGYIKSEGIVEGYEDGTYKPDALINRAEFTKIIVESSGYFTDEEIEDCSSSVEFPDVPVDEWYAKYVCTAANNGMVEGYPNGTFQPENEINFAEAAKVIVSGYGYIEESESEVWYTPYVEVLENMKAIPLGIYSVEKEITRGEMAEIIYRLRVEGLEKPSAGDLLK